MKILVLGGDGYLGWPTAMHFAASGDEVWIADNFAKRKWELEDGIEPLLPTPTLHRRVQCWNTSGSGSEIRMKVGDLINHRFVYNLFREVQPDTIVHYAEQPSALFHAKQGGRGNDPAQQCYRQPESVIRHATALPRCAPDQARHHG